MMTRASADLWFRHPTPLGVAAEDAGAFGTVREPVGGDAKKVILGRSFFPDLPFIFPAP